MPFESLRIIPGVDVEETRADNAAGISESNYIRWRDNLPEKRGGCTAFNNFRYIGKSRCLHAWQGLSQDKRIAIGTTERLYVSFGSNAIDITPQIVTHNVPIVGGRPFLSSTINSSIITVDDNIQYGTTVYDTVIFNTQIEIANVLIFGAYDIVSINSNGTYNIDAGIKAQSTTTTYYFPVFTTTTNSALVRCDIPNIDPRISTAPIPYYYASGEVFSITVATEIGGINLYGDYTIKDADPSGFTFTAQNAANQATSQSLNYGQLNLTYYVTLGPIQQGLGYGSGFYTSYTEVAGVVSASTFGGFATITLNGSYNFQASEVVSISGVGAPYDGSWTLTSATFNSVSFQLASGPSYGAGGTVTVNHHSGGYGTGIVPVEADRGAKLQATDWTLDNWGEILLACPRNGPIFTWAPSQGYGNAAMIPQAPVVNTGMFLAMPQRQIMAWGSTYSGIQNPLQIRWCDVNNYNVWESTITNQAGGYNIPTGSLIVRGIQGPTQQYWFTDIDCYVSQYTGPPFVYGFNKVGSGCGLIGQKAVCMLHSNMYWMSQKQFFVLSGTNAAQTIPCTVWDFVFQNLNLNYVDNIRAAANSMFNEVNWFFPTVNSTSGENDAYVCFNVLYNEWDYGYLDRSAWIDQSVLGGPLGSQNFYDADAVDPWTAMVYQHETSNNLAGLPINAYFKTGYFTLSNGNDLVFVDWFLPDMKWGEYSQAPNATIEMTFYVTDYPGDTPVQYGPFSMTSTTPYIEPRFRGRYVQIEVASNDLNSFWRLGSMRYRYAVSGRR